MRQTSKTRGHILNSSTGILILNRVVVIYQPLLSKKYVYKQILPFVTHGLTSLFPVYSLVMKIILLHVFFLSCKQICFLILSYVRYNYYHIYYSFFSILFFFILFNRKVNTISHLYSIYFVPIVSFINLLFIQFVYLSSRVINRSFWKIS